MYSLINLMLDPVRTQLSPVSMASASLDFHFSATSFARGSSGLGALSNAWIDSSTVRICRAGDHLSERKRKTKMETNKSIRTTESETLKVQKKRTGILSCSNETVVI